MSVMNGVTTDFWSPAVAGEWDRLAGRHFYSSHRWLFHTGAVPGARADLVLSRHGNALAAGVPVAEVTAPPMPLYRWDDLLAGYGLPTIGANGLLVGPRQGYQTHLLVADGHQRRDRVAELLATIRQRHAARRGAERTACVAMYVTTRDALLLRAAGVTATPVLLGGDAWIALPPDGWPAWLADQPRNRKVKARKEYRRFTEAGYRIDHRPLGACAEQLAVAAATTQARYGHTEGPDHYRRALRSLADGMGCQARVALCSSGDGDPVGFCIYFDWQDTVFLRWAGFDYPRLAGVAEYFNLLYYEQIRTAPARGARWLHAGIKSVEAKARRGAQLHPLWLVDLTPDSPLAAADGSIRAHNARGYRALAEDPQTAGALTDRAAWEVFL